jgi:hypothetical protein
MFVDPVLELTRKTANCPLTSGVVAASDECVLIDSVFPGEPLVISFGFADWQQPPPFDFFGRLKKLEAARGRAFNRILLRDPSNAWYQRGIPGLGANVDSMARSLAALVQVIQPSDVVTLGQSMGAYGAVLFAHLLGARRAVVFGCLSLLDAARARQIGDTRWLPVMQDFARDPPTGAVPDLAAWCAEQSHHPELRIHVGMLPDADTPDAGVNLDLWHARRLAMLPGARLRLHANAAHAVIGTLREEGTLDDWLQRDLLAAPPVAAPRPWPAAPRPRSAAPMPDPGWRQWVAENRLRGCDPASMQAGMVNAGVDEGLARQALAEIDDDPVYKAAVKMRQLHAKLASMMRNLQQLWASAPDYGHVEKRSRVSRGEFFERYVRGCRPLVITGLASDWPALQRWSLADLRSRFGHLDVEIQGGRDADRHYEVNKLEHRRTVRLADFIDRIGAIDAGNDEYLTANNEVMRRPEFAPLLDDIGTLPDFCQRERLAVASSFWLGPRGAVTPLHHDTLMLMHTQVVGRKRWRLISPLDTPRLYNHRSVFSDVDPESPDLQRHPDFAGVQVLDVVVEPGETLFLPLGWWHQVRSLDVAMSFSFTNIDTANNFSFDNPDITNW